LRINQILAIKIILYFISQDEEHPISLTKVLQATHTHTHTRTHAQCAVFFWGEVQDIPNFVCDHIMYVFVPSLEDLKGYL